jgi:hypothetical protein
LRNSSIVILGVALLAGATASAQPVEVSYVSGLVTIRCNNAPLASIFERIEAASGIELSLEDEVKSKKLSANLDSLPLSMAISRLLEGAGVNYIVMMDPYNWARVDKIFVGGGGGGPNRGAAPARGPVVNEEPPEEAYEDEVPPESFEEGVEGMPPDAMDPSMEAPQDPMQNPDEFMGEDPNAFQPPGSSPIPEFIPPAQSFPRSRFTPGLPRQNQPQQPGAVQPGQEGMGTAPAAFPFTDPFGRPIPIPPGMNPQQQQQQQQQQNRRPQQQ